MKSTEWGPFRFMLQINWQESHDVPAPDQNQYQCNSALRWVGLAARSGVCYNLPHPRCPSPFRLSPDRDPTMSAPLLRDRVAARSPIPCLSQQRGRHDIVRPRSDVASPARRQVHNVPGLWAGGQVPGESFRLLAYGDRGQAISVGFTARPSGGAAPSFPLVVSAMPLRCRMRNGDHPNGPHRDNASAPAAGRPGSIRPATADPARPDPEADPQFRNPAAVSL